MFLKWGRGLLFHFGNLGVLVEKKTPPQRRPELK